MSAIASARRTIAHVALSLLLAIAFMPVMAWGAVAPQAHAQEQPEVAPLPEAAVAELSGEEDAPLVAQASNTDSLSISGVDYYNFAREVLTLVNAERAKVGARALTLDASLTEAAMQRAAETNLHFDHTRPNGSSWTTAVPAGLRGSNAENIAAGQTTPQAVVTSWMNSAGHKANMLNPTYTTIGIGCFNQGGAYYWTQLFSNRSASGNVGSPAVNKKHTVDVSYGTCTGRHAFNLNYNFANKPSLGVGEEFKMSYNIVNAGWNNYYCAIDGSSATWTSSNTGVCTVVGGTLSTAGTVKGVAAGSATIKATLPSGKSLSHTWTVSQQVGGATLDIPNQTYTGKPIEPNPTVTLGGKTLVRGTDYDVSYTYNVNVGTASMIITGKGRYSGTKDAKFTIVPAAIDSVALSQSEFSYDGTEKRPTLTVKSGDILLTENKDYFLSYPGDMTAPGNHTITVTAMGNFTGTMAANYTIVGEDPGISMFRLYNPNSGEHFYTASTVERDHLVDVGWNYEGIGWTAPSAGEPVYRLYNPYAGEHHYTPSAGERDALVAAGWNDEGEGWKSGGKVPLHRQYNPNEYANNHNYTSSDVEYQHLDSLGWQYEGVAWYALR